METPIQITTDKSKIDLDFVHQYLSEEAYWSKGRSREAVERSIANSLCFSMFDIATKDQMAFARVATDYVVFAWVMDLFVSKTFRGNGYAKQLIRYILEYPELSRVNGFGLRTNDAQGLYEQFGFAQVPNPETWMFKKNAK